MTALTRLVVLSAALGISFYGCRSLLPSNELGDQNHKVGIERQKDGSWIEYQPKRMPFQFLGGREGGLFLGADERPTEFSAEPAAVTEPFFLPKGSVKISGFAYGDCPEAFMTNFSVSAYGASNATKAEKYPHFIMRTLPAQREEIRFEGILPIDVAGMYILEIDSDSPLWGVRIAGTDDRGAWTGLVPVAYKPAEKHCWTVADQQREDAKQDALVEEERYKQELRDAHRDRWLERVRSGESLR